MEGLTALNACYLCRVLVADKRSMAKEIDELDILEMVNWLTGHKFIRYVLKSHCAAVLHEMKVQMQLRSLLAPVYVC